MIDNPDLNTNSLSGPIEADVRFKWCTNSVFHSSIWLVLRFFLEVNTGKQWTIDEWENYNSAGLKFKIFVVSLIHLDRIWRRSSYLNEKAKPDSSRIVKSLNIRSPLFSYNTTIIINAQNQTSFFESHNKIPWSHFSYLIFCDPFWRRSDSCKP